MSFEKIVAAMAVNPQAKFARLLNVYALMAVVLGALGGLAVIYVNNPLFFLLALAGLVVFLISLYSEAFGLLVLVFISYIRLSDILTEYHGFISFAKPFVAVLVLTILVRWGVFGERPKGWERPVVLFGLLSLTGLFSLFYSPVPDRVLDKLIDDLKDMLIAVIVVILLQQGPMFRRVLWTLILVGLILGTLSVYQYVSGNFYNSYGGFAISQQHQIVGAVDDFRSTGPIGDPNFFAQMMVVLVAIALERFIHEKKTILRLVALWTFAMCVLTVLFTYSRGGLLAMVAAVLVVLFFYPPKGLQIPLMIFALVIFVSLLPPNYLNRLAGLLELFQPRNTLRVEEQSLQGRLSENLTAMEMIKSNPLFGVGLNSFNYLFPRYSKKLGLALVATEREAHNLYLESAAETGIIGFSVLMLVLLSCYQTLFSARKRFMQAGMRDYAGMVTGFMAGFTGYLVAAMNIHNAFPRYFYLLIGISLALRLVAQNTAVRRPGTEGEL